MESSALVVVGVDGSEPSRAALRYAVSEANRRAGSVRVVTAYQHPEYWSAIYGAPIPLDDAEVEHNIRANTVRLVDEVLAGDPVPPNVDVAMVAGSAGPVLVDAARDADLLVVGHRGRGSVASALLGSVGLYCVLNAECPVTVVRPSAPRTSAERGEQATVSTR